MQTARPEARADRQAWAGCEAEGETESAARTVKFSILSSSSSTACSTWPSALAIM